MKVDRGITIDMNDAGPAARAAEEAGYDGVWTAEVKHDPFLPLAVAATHTSRVDLGTSIAVAFGRSPMTLANVADDLQRYSDGRFVLGLGSQIKTHIEKRFSMPFSHPAPRMREMVLAIRAIWRSWHEDEKLDFRGDFYTHTLMTPNFNPGPNPNGPARIMLAAVGELMTEVAGEVADGMLCHGFTTEAHLRNTTIPALERGLAKAGRTRADVEVKAGGFVVTGNSAEEMAEKAVATRKQIAFYGSTPAYKVVLDEHGWGDLQPELNRLSKLGRWDEMGTLIDDEVLHTFAVVAEPQDLAREIVARYGDVVDRISFTPPEGGDPDVWNQVIADLRKADQPA
jgi:probable F420-dependent oxidoreductase